MKRHFLLILCAFVIEGTAWCQDTGRASRVLLAGEVLRYKVQWAFIRLGTITLRTEQDTCSLDGSRFKLVMRVESNPDLRFLWIQEINESYVEPEGISACRFLGRHRNGDDLIEIRHRYDRESKTAYTSRVDMNAGVVLETDTIHPAAPFTDGPSLLARARAYSRSRGRVVVPTMVNGAIRNTTLEYGGGIENVEIDRWEGEIRTRRYVGRAEWSGGTSSGLGGDFSGWVSDDDAAVPIRAEMRILLGSIVLELEDWTRPGWVPPRPAAVAEGRPR